MVVRPRPIVDQQRAPHPRFADPLPASRGEGSRGPSPRLRGEGGRRPDEGPWILALLLLLAVACRRDVSSHLDDVQKMAYGVKPAVVRISAYATAEFHYGQTSVDTGAGGSGSGFIIHPDGYILTSGHVVAATRDAAALQRDLLRNGAIIALRKKLSTDELRNLQNSNGLETSIAALAAGGHLEKIAVVNEVELSNGERLPFQVERYSPALSEHGTDLALLRVGRRGLPVLTLGDSDAVRVGESIWSVGYPSVASSTDEVIGGWLSRDSDLEATFNPGIVTAIKRNVANTPVFQSNVAIYHGNSGGPAVDHDGNVIGISTWGRSDAEAIKFLVPINVAKSLLAGAKVPPNVESDFNRHYRDALEAAGEGKWNAANSELATAAKLFPNSPDLIRFRRDTDRALQTMPLWQQHPIATALGGGGIGIGVIGTVVLLVSLRRNRIPRDITNQTTDETIISPHNRDAALAPTALLGRFTILNGERAGQRLGLGGSGIRIGRESSICEIVLENPKVSRLHAEVVQIDGKVLLIDRNSSNGTYVNDQKIDKRFLRDGDIIYFGGRNAVAVAFHA